MRKPASKTLRHQAEAKTPAPAPAVVSPTPFRVLVVAPGHPEFSGGQAEQAAFDLYRGLSGRDACNTWFLGCDSRPNRPDTTFTQRLSETEYLYSPRNFDWFRFANHDPRFPAAFRELLLELRPDVVHFHHYATVGVEALRHVRSTLPNARIVLTLHDYQAICANFGRMVTAPDRLLCQQARVADCIRCLKGRDEADFYLRNRYIQQFFGLVDCFVAPSRFLADRYIRWGVEAGRIAVIENATGGAASVTRRIAPGAELRLGLIGELSPQNGPIVLFDAIHALEVRGTAGIRFDIHGDYRGQPDEFQKLIRTKLGEYARYVDYHGPYDAAAIDLLVQSVDAVIVPATWWENSPAIIQAAYRNRRPVICSDIGGMAEKVLDGVDGFHFRTGNAADLATLLARLDRNRQQLRHISETMSPPVALADILDAHLALYSGSVPKSGAQRLTAAQSEYQQSLVAEVFASGFVDDALFATAIGLPKTDPAGIQRYLALPNAARPDVSWFFDREYYLARYGDVRGRDVDPLVHFMAWGVAEKRSPHPLIDPAFMALHIRGLPDPLTIDVLNVALHRDAADPSPHFDRAFYRRQLGAADDLSNGSLLHYLSVGMARGLKPSPFAADLPAPRDGQFDARAALRSLAAPAAGGQAADPNVERFGQALLTARARFTQIERGANPLRFAYDGQPDISVIMVLHNGFESTLQSLAALRASYPGPLQLILIDTGSTDETRYIEQYVTGANLVSLETDVGFAKGANAALNFVLADTALFLASDAEVAADALAASLRRMRSDDTVGAVGGRIITPLGLLQQAGGIVWRDGLATYYLQGRTPAEAEANFVRDVDYCSSSYMLARTSLLRELQGFDDAFFSRAYHDADLCLRIQDAGYRVVYDPAVVVQRSQIETPVSANAAHEVLAQKHRQRLRRHAALDARAEVFARSARPARGRVLVIEDQIPLRRLGSGFVRTNDIVRRMAELGFEVTVFPVIRRDHNLTAVYTDFPDTVEVMHDRGLSDLQRLLLGRRGYFDTIWVCRIHNLDQVKPVLDAVGRDATGNARIILDTEAINAPRLRLHRRLWGDAEPFDIDQEARAELRNASLCQAIITTSPAEADLLGRLGFPDVHVLGHVRPIVPTSRGWAERSGILFVGSMLVPESPNYDSLCWFVDEVLPIIERRLGWQTRLTIAGYTDPAVSLDRFRNHPRVTVLGAVPDLTPLYQRHRVFVAPTRYAAGLPYKVHEAASFGLPVAVTDVLREQLGWANGVELLSAPADDPAAFAEQVLAIYSDQALWQSLRDAAVRRLETECGDAAYRLEIEAILEDRAR